MGDAAVQVAKGGTALTLGLRPKTQTQEVELQREDRTWHPHFPFLHFCILIFLLLTSPLLLRYQLLRSSQLRSVGITAGAGFN